MCNINPSLHTCIIVYINSYNVYTHYNVYEYNNDVVTMSTETPSV